MNNKILLLTVVLTGTALTLAAVQADTVYRWMDKHGQVHYSQTPPPAPAPGQKPCTSMHRRRTR